MNSLRTWALVATLLAVTYSATAAQPDYRRPTRTERYDPFLEEDQAAGRAQRAGEKWIGGADNAKRSSNASSERSGDNSQAVTNRARGRYVAANDESLDSQFRPASYEPEYVVEEVDVYHPVVACDTGSCDVGCGDVCAPAYGHPAPPCRWIGFGEYLLLRPRGFDVAYALEQDVSGAITLPTSPVQQVDPDVSSGFRAGLGLCLSPCDRIDATFTHFEADSVDTFNSTPAGQLANRMQSLIVSQQLTEDWETAWAEAEVDYQLLDFDYRRQYCGVEWSAGVRVAWLDQDLIAQYEREATGTRTGISDVDFQGAGLRFGLGKEHHDPCLGWLVYMRGAANFLGGQFNADYNQTFQGGSTLPVNESATSWQADRLVSTFDVELGFGWQDPCGRCRFTAGYVASYWFNVVTTDEWIAAVQANQYTDISSTVGFDGLAVRGELRF